MSTGSYFDDGGFPAGKGWQNMPFPDFNDEQAYALEIKGDSMKPAYRDGDLIILSPGSPLKRGNRVVVKMMDGEVMVKELRRKTKRAVTLQSFNSKHSQRTVSMKDVFWISRIVWASQ